MTDPSRSESDQDAPAAPEPASAAASAAPQTGLTVHHGILLLLIAFALHAAAALLMPIAFAVLAMMLLAPLVRVLTRRGLNTGVASGLVVFGSVALVGGGVVALAGPATEWIQEAPKTLRTAKRRIDKLMRPLAGARNMVTELEKMPIVGDGDGGGTGGSGGDDRQSLLASIGASTAEAVTTSLSVIFLTFFLLSATPLFRAKLKSMTSAGDDRTSVLRVMEEIEGHMSSYLIANTVVGLIVGAATFGLLMLAGISNAILFAAAAFLLNFIPYVGALATLVLIALAALVSFDDPGRTLLTVGGFVLINVLEGNLLTPMVLGRKMPLNAVVIFVSLLFWGFLWGIPGAIIGVPMTVLLQVICAHRPRWRTVAVLLDR